jgi:hypothetical protein
MFPCLNCNIMLKFNDSSAAEELYGVNIMFKFSTIDDMTLYVTAQLQKQTIHPRIICRGHYTDIFTW